MLVAKAGIKSGFRSVSRALSKQALKGAAKSMTWAGAKNTLVSATSGILRGAWSLVKLGSQAAWKGLSFTIRHPLVALWKVAKFPF